MQVPSGQTIPPKNILLYEELNKLLDRTSPYLTDYRTDEPVRYDDFSYVTGRKTVQGQKLPALLIQIVARRLGREWQEAENLEEARAAILAGSRLLNSITTQIMFIHDMRQVWMRYRRGDQLKKWKKVLRKLEDLAMAAGGENTREGLEIQKDLKEVQKLYQDVEKALRAAGNLESFRFGYLATDGLRGYKAFQESFQKLKELEITLADQYVSKYFPNGLEENEAIIG
ncbi:hypothetical protein VTK26DRAFT_2202 [Humicola hyalothermophila]